MALQSLLRVFAILLVVTIFNANVYAVSNAINIEDLFSPSGGMGDGEYGQKYVKFFGADSNHPHSSPSSIKVDYTFGPKRWAGIYWLNKPDNWGDKPGVNYSGKGISRLTFWARGDAGGEIVEFKTGNVDDSKKKYRDSFGSTTGRISLTTTWRKYNIDLAHANLESVIGGFCWVSSADYNTGKRITFYIDDIMFE